MSLDMVVLRLREERLELLLETRDRPLCPLLAVAGPAHRRDPGSGSGRGSPSPVGRVGAGALLQRAGLYPRQPGAGSPRLVHHPRLSLSGGSRWGAVRGRWHPLDALPGLQLAFDHGKLVAMGLERLRIKSRYSTLPLHLLGAEFTLSEVQRAFEIVLQTPMNTAAFRKRLHRADILVDTGRKRTGKQRPAILYRLETPCCVMFDQVMHGAEA